MKITIIIPYFGQVPELFPFWLKSVEYNKNIDFLLFTDNYSCILENYRSKNLRIIKTCFSQFEQLIASKLSFPIKLKNAYKLCEFRPAYGFLLSSYLLDSDYWGYCDMDLIFGQIMPFIQLAINKKFDKIYRHGHLTLIRNTRNNNSLFLKEMKGIIPFRRAVLNSAAYHFDENGGINPICENLKKSIFDSDDFADIDFRFNNLIKISDEHSNWCDSLDTKQLYCWKNGVLKEYQLQGDQVNINPKIYIHLQKRALNLAKNIDFSYPVIISSKGIFNYDGNINKNFIEKYSYKENNYTSKYKEYLKHKRYRFFRWSYIKYKIDKFIYR